MSGASSDSLLLPPLSKIEERALELWREREMHFPPFTRRMTPDAMDKASGTWARMLDQAGKEIGMLEFFDLKDLWAMVKHHEFAEGTAVGVRWFDNKPAAVVIQRSGFVRDVPIPDSILKEVRVRITVRDKTPATVNDGLPF
jgi:hypothetical protein